MHVDGAPDRGERTSTAPLPPAVTQWGIPLTQAAEDAGIIPPFQVSAPARPAPVFPPEPAVPEVSPPSAFAEVEAAAPPTSEFFEAKPATTSEFFEPAEPVRSESEPLTLTTEPDFLLALEVAEPAIEPEPTQFESIVDHTFEPKFDEAPDFVADTEVLETADLQVDLGEPEGIDVEPALDVVNDDLLEIDWATPREPAAAFTPSPPEEPVVETVTAESWLDDLVPVGEVFQEPVAALEQPAAERAFESVVDAAFITSDVPDLRSELAARFERLAAQLRSENLETTLDGLARGDRFDAIVAGFLAGYLSRDV